MTRLLTVNLLRVLFVTFCVAIGVIVSGETQPAPPRSMREMVMMSVVYRIAGMDKVTVKSNLKYTEVNNPHLLMDVCHPPNLIREAVAKNVALTFANHRKEFMDLTTRATMIVRVKLFKARLLS
jgi:hypothetical protein